MATEKRDENGQVQLFSGKGKGVNYAKGAGGEDEGEGDDYVTYDLPEEDIYNHVELEEDLPPKQFRRYRNQPQTSNLPSPSGMYEFVEGKIPYVQS